MPNTELPKSKRFRFAFYAFHVYIIIGVVAMYKQADLVSLGTYLLMITTPVALYILGDTFRPSNLSDLNK